MIKKSLCTGIVLFAAFISLTGCDNLVGLNNTRKTVSIAEITGVDRPVANGTAKTVINETAEYSGTVQWKPHPADGKFAANQVYTATITLKPKEKYSLIGVKKNFFKLAGAQTSNQANSGIIMVSFPKATDPSGNGTSPEISALTGVVLTVTGAKIDLKTGTSTAGVGSLSASLPPYDGAGSEFVWKSYQFISAPNIAMVTLRAAANYTFAANKINTSMIDASTVFDIFGEHPVSSNLKYSKNTVDNDTLEFILTYPGTLVSKAITGAALATSISGWNPVPADTNPVSNFDAASLKVQGNTIKGGSEAGVNWADGDGKGGNSGGIKSGVFAQGGHATAAITLKAGNGYIFEAANTYETTLKTRFTAGTTGAITVSPDGKTLSFTVTYAIL